MNAASLVGTAPAGSCDPARVRPFRSAAPRAQLQLRIKQFHSKPGVLLTGGQPGNCREDGRGRHQGPQNHRASCTEDACPTQSLARAPLGLQTPQFRPRLGGGGWSGDTAWEEASNDVHQDHGWGATGSTDCLGQERGGWWGSEGPLTPQAQASLGWGCGSCLGRGGDPRCPSLQVLLCSDGRGGLPAVLGEAQAVGASGLDAGLGTVRGSCWSEVKRT